MLRVGEIVFSRKEHANWFSNTKELAMKISMQVILYRQTRVHLCIQEYMYLGIHMYRYICIDMCISIYLL